MQVAENRINPGCFVGLQVQRLWGFLDLILKHRDTSEYLDDSHLSLPLVTLVTLMCTEPQTRGSQPFMHHLKEMDPLTSPSPFPSHPIPLSPCKRTSLGGEPVCGSFHSCISDFCHLGKPESRFCYALLRGGTRRVEAGSVPRPGPRRDQWRSRPGLPL